MSYQSIMMQSIFERRCKSPIEIALASALEKMCEDESGTVIIGEIQYWNEMPTTLPTHIGTYASITFIMPQVPIGKYKADFAIGRMVPMLYSTNGGNEVEDLSERFEKLPLVVVECDGHDFHYRTKEQAQHDRERDRFIMTQGYRVVRFTGSEIHRNAEKCAEGIMEIFGRLEREHVSR